MALTSKEVEILQALFSAQAVKTPAQHRVYSFHFNPATRAGATTYNAAKSLEGTGLIRIASGTQKNIYQIFVRE